MMNQCIFLSSSNLSNHMSSLIEDVDELLEKNIGDTWRLKHIKETLENNTILYVSDRQYLTNLCKSHLDQKNPEHKKQTYVKKQSYVKNQNRVKYSEKSEEQMYSENEQMVNQNSMDDEIIEVNQNTVASENTVITENTLRHDELNSDVQESALFCNNCGNKILEQTQFCTDCGNSLDNLVQANMTTPQNYGQGRKPSAAWYLLPLAFYFIGGIIAWACLKDRDPRMAKKNLILGIIVTILPVIVGLVAALGIMAIPYSGLAGFR